MTGRLPRPWSSIQKAFLKHLYIEYKGDIPACQTNAKLKLLRFKKMQK